MSAVAPVPGCLWQRPSCAWKMDALAVRLPFAASFTLDEPSDLVKILAAAAQTKHISYYHHGMTTGLGLMHRQNRDDTDWTQKK